MKNLKNWYLFLESLSDKNQAILLRNNKKFWIGSVNILDGYIEEVHTYEKAQSCDFHHSFYFSTQQLKKIDEEECGIFWITNGEIYSNWRNGELPRNIIYKIKQQIKIIE